MNILFHQIRKITQVMHNYQNKMKLGQHASLNAYKYCPTLPSIIKPQIVREHCMAEKNYF